MFHIAMIRAGRAGGHGAIRDRRVKGIASMRKFGKYGDWHYFTLLPFALDILFRKGGLTATAKDYWYRDVRE